MKIKQKILKKKKKRPDRPPKRSKDQASIRFFTVTPDARRMK